MKIFKWWHKLIIGIVAAIVAGLFFFVAFHSKIEDVQRLSLFSTMFFGLASACVSLLALMISIQTFVDTRKKEKEKLEKDAANFITDNSEEIGYIPLCVVASAYNRHGNYKRAIYRKFNKLTNNQQREVLKQLNYECEIISDDAWIDLGLKRISNFIEKYQLGNNLLYDNAKYYRRSINYSEEEYDLTIEYGHIFRSSYFGIPKYKVIRNEIFDEGVSFDDYLNYYVNAFVCNDIRINLAPKPLDYLFETQDLGNCDEFIVCFWMMCVVDSIAELIMSKYKDKVVADRFPASEGSIKTFEDRFLSSLAILYNLSKYKEEDD